MLREPTENFQPISDRASTETLRKKQRDSINVRIENLARTHLSR
jgi:hypothetical protein